MKVKNHWLFKDSEKNIQDLYEDEQGNYYKSSYSMGADGILKEVKEINSTMASEIIKSLTNGTDTAT